MTERIGFWIDLGDAYYTLTNDYIESVWWLLRRIYDKGLLYQGFKVVPYCPRCGTALSSHELAQGYKDVTEDSVYLRFRLTAPAAEKLTGAPGEPVSLAVWTTTPWTLISNVAAAVHPDVGYALVESRGERFVLARDLVEKVLGKKAVVERELRGAELLGLEYEAPYAFLPVDRRAHYVIGGDYVTTTDGTGIVHIAPAFGEEDMKVGLENDLPVVNAVDTEGRFVAEVTPWAGRFVKDADPAIIAELKERGLLLGVEPYEHSYPFCWRCDTPLLYYSKPTWYIRTTAIKDQLLAANDAVVWHPEHIKTGRFGEWLANNVDWALGRDRYWGTPLPIWQCAEGHTHCVGSIAELREMAAGPLPPDMDLHRPFVDDVVLHCPECGGEMRRVDEVIDAWFDSGSMPFAQWHYPFENEDLFRERFPADFICEAIDQTRGWFYSLLAVATLVEGRSSYKRCLCLGHILDGDGQKMSKSHGNVVQPDDVLDRQGADAFRWYLFTASSPWFARRFSVDLVDEVVRKFLLTLWNTYSFFTVYANIDRFDPADEPVPLAERPLLDRWLLGELDRLVRTVTDGLEEYDVTNSGRAIQEFVDDLSNWYVRRSRRRFWKSESDADKLAAYHTLYEALVTLAKLLAPFTPFVAEEIYQNLVRSVDETAPESVHLCAWPRRRRRGGRRRRELRHGGGAPRRRDGPRGAQRRRRQDASAAGRGGRGAAGRRARRGRAAPRRRARRAQRQGAALRRRRRRARVLHGQAEPARARAAPRQAARRRCARRSPRPTRRRWSRRCAPAKAPPPSCVSPTGASSVSPRRTSSSRPARPTATGSRATAAASSRSRPSSTTPCARRASCASSCTPCSSRARTPACASRTRSTWRSTCPRSSPPSSTVTRRTSRARPWPAALRAAAAAEPAAAGAHTEVAKVEGLEIGIGLSPTGTIFTTPYG